jgi:hypothetical protein
MSDPFAEMREETPPETTTEEPPITPEVPQSTLSLDDIVNTPLAQNPIVENTTPTSPSDQQKTPSKGLPIAAFKKAGIAVGGVLLSVAAIFVVFTMFPNIFTPSTPSNETDTPSEPQEFDEPPHSAATDTGGNNEPDPSLIETG